MVNKGGKLLFLLGLALCLISIVLSTYVISHAQSGPSWEVPVAVMQELNVIPRISMALTVLALIFYIWASNRGEINKRATFGFFVLLPIAFALPFVVWVFNPEQWAYQFVTLSFLATICIVPVVIAALVLFWLIGFRWLRNPHENVA